MPNPIASALASLAGSYRDYLLDKQYQQMIDRILSQISQPYQLPQTAPESRIPQGLLPKVEEVAKSAPSPVPLPTSGQIPTTAEISSTPMGQGATTAYEPSITALSQENDIMSYITSQEGQITQQINDLMAEYQKQKDNQVRALLQLSANPAFRMMPPERQQYIMNATAMATEPKIDPNAINSLIKARENLSEQKIKFATQEKLEKMKQEGTQEIEKMKLNKPEVIELGNTKFILYPLTGELKYIGESPKKYQAFVSGGTISVFDPEEGKITQTIGVRGTMLQKNLQEFADKYGVSPSDIFNDENLFSQFATEYGLKPDKIETTPTGYDIIFGSERIKVDIPEKIKEYEVNIKTKLADIENKKSEIQKRNEEIKNLKTGGSSKPPKEGSSIVYKTKEEAYAEKRRYETENPGKTADVRPVTGGYKVYYSSGIGLGLGLGMGLPSVSGIGTTPKTAEEFLKNYGLK